MKEEIQQHYSLPSNLNFWIMLQLTNHTTGFNTPLAEELPDDKAFNIMEQYVLILNHTMGASKSRLMSCIWELDTLARD